MLYRSHLDSPIHSTSSQCSSTGRPRTKAAMKGYENLKVSIPTTGLDLQHALDRSPSSNASCKLSALAEIALGTDVPIVDELLRTKCPSPLLTHELSTSSRIPPIKLDSSNKLGILTISTDHAATGSSALQTSPFKSVELSPKKQLVMQAANKVIGNQSTAKERKKKQPPAARRPAATNKKIGKTIVFPKSLPSDLPKDIYDFEESADSNDSAIKPLTHVRANKDDARKPDAPVEEKPKPTTVVDDADGGESTSYSDRDGFFNYNSVDNTESSEDNGSDSGSAATATTTNTKRTSKTPVPVQKKSLIMGRIFKNVKKNPGPSKSPKKEKREVIKSMVKKEMGDILDLLKPCDTNEVPEPKQIPSFVEASGSGIDNKADDASSSASRSRKSREIISLEAEWGMSIEEIKDLIGVAKRKTPRRCAANRPKNIETWSSDEYEDFHSTKDIIIMIQEAEKRAERTKIRAAKNAAAAAEATKSITPASCTATSATIKQDEKHVVTPSTKTTSSSETALKATKKVATDQQSSKDVKKAKTKGETKRVTVFSGDSDFESDWNRTAKRASIKNRRRTIAFREEVYHDSDEDHTPPNTRAHQKTPGPEQASTKDARPVTPMKSADVEITKPVTTPVAAEITAVEEPIASSSSSASLPSSKPKENKPTKDDKQSKKGRPRKEVKLSKDGKPLPRRKRNASDVLYYEMSSSDEEFGRIESNENDYEGDDDNNLEQHGWIVGDSHKKLVTLLAHAKGKKVDDCAVKEAVHRKK